MLDLSGPWQVAADPANQGREQRWFDAVQPEARDLGVPGEVHTVFPDVFGVFWYWRRFTPPRAAEPHERVWLRFGAVDYLAQVWLNGVLLGEHEGGETPFELPAGAALRPGAENLLAVRVLNPCHERIDGFVLDETPHRNKRIPQPPGSCYNYGGILLPVLLEYLPAVRVSDLFVQAEPSTGQVRVDLTVANDSGVGADGTLTVRLVTQRDQSLVAEAQRAAAFADGETTHAVSLSVAQPHLWDLDDPFLYRAEVAASAGGHEHRHAARFGFRDFRVADGWFQLNGRRVFLRSTHTGNHFPTSWTAPVLTDFQRRDLVYAKALGFNCVRFIAGVAWPEQLDLCDELGLMVYEECLAAWCLADSPAMAERFDRDTAAMIQRDRNHPCVTIWGLQNETGDSPMFRQAVAALPLVRDLDPTRLVLLQSGRWDGQWSIGSVANPGSRQWQHVWGAEGVDEPACTAPMNPGGYKPGAGDAHVYPRTPQATDINTFIRRLGHDSQPVFLSEYGIGSLMNVVDEGRRFEQIQAAPDLPDAALIRSMVERLEADWQRWGFDGVYAFVEDMLRESQRLHGRQRRLGFDLIRSNPQLCGFNLTGILDHAITGEGVWTFWREFKPGLPDVLRDGWAPLRWCLFCEPGHGYVGRPLTVEAVLANEDVLPPGDYPVQFRILGPDGVAWSERTTLHLPPTGSTGRPPLAVAALEAELTIAGPPGRYELAARLERGGCPAGDRTAFYLSAPVAPLTDALTVTTWGLPAEAEAWLAAHGVRCQPPGSAEPAGVIVVGRPEPEQRAEGWPPLWRQVERGATVVVLDPRALADGGDSMHWWPLSPHGSCWSFGDWLYHKECVANRHPVWAGLPAPGILDWDWWGQVVSHELLSDQGTPDEVIGAAFATGYCCEGGYASGIMLGSWRLGSGRVVVNTFRVLDELDRHPAAERLLLNLVAWAAR